MSKVMRGRKLGEVFDKPLTATLHGGEYTVEITGSYEDSPIKVTSKGDSFQIPFFRFTHYFREEDAQVLIDRMPHFDSMSFEEFRNYFESNEEFAAPIIADIICGSYTRPWYRDGVPVIVHTMARSARCNGRHERLVAMFYDIILDMGYAVKKFTDCGFNVCVYDALRVYEKASDIKDESERIKMIAASGNQMAINVKRYDLEYLIQRANENRSWRRRNKLNGYLELLNNECNGK